MLRDKATLLDIAQSARLVSQFIHGIDKASFVDDVKTQSAVLHQLMVLGEAVKRLSQEFRSRYQDVPWTLIAAMRNRLIHEYDDVDLDEVWATATKDIPQLLAHIEPLLPAE